MHAVYSVVKGFRAQMGLMTSKEATMREFLRHPILYITETIRRRWFEIMVVSGATWAVLILALTALSVI